MLNCKILCLGNEFIKDDSLAKKIGNELKKEGFEIININDSFQLIEFINSNKELIILDVVSGLKEVKLIQIEDLKNSKIITAHDFDAGFVLKLIGDDKNLKIIGIPLIGDLLTVKEHVKKLF